MPSSRRRAIGVTRTSLLLALPLVIYAQSPPPELFSSTSLNRVLALANSTATPASWPEYTSTDGQWQLEPESDWTSGFFPSSLFLLHERTSALCPRDADGTDWLSLARTWSAGLYNPSADVLSSWTHDVGFNSLPILDELRINGDNETAKAQVLANAPDLASRFSSVVGCTRSWDRGSGDFEVIIDNMVNLQLLVAASTLSGNSTYLDMAISHANKTMANHVREDGSSFHVVDYSPTTGEVQWRGTAQGLSNSSTWSRGQAWGAFGFALMANETGNADFLETSRRMSTFFLDALPSGGVPYWDFNATAPTTLDTSAATIMASSLLLLSSLEATLGNETAAAHWSSSAVTLLSNVVDVAVKPWSGASIMGNGTVNNRADPPNNNTGIVYGDTYFLQAGNWLLSLGLANCTDGSTAQGASPTALSSTLFSSNGSSSSNQAGGRSGSGEGGSGASSGCRRAVEGPAGIAGLVALVAFGLALL
ncbi:hypothetical protein JCM8097_002554 [Rhodosporidiobolus ruineniae]